MARTTGIITGTQYVKLVDILHGRRVRRDSQSVRALITRGLVVEVGGHVEVADADTYDRAVREYEEWAEARLPRMSSGPVPTRPDMSGYPSTAEFMATTRARFAA